MKTKIFLVGSLLTAGIALTSCSDDFLDQKNTTSPNQETFFDSDEAIDKAMYPLYNYVWQSFNDKAYYGMGDGRANNLTAQYSDYIYPYTNFNETSLSPGLSDAWGSLYSVVAQSNNTINNILTYSTSAVSEEAKTRGVAEARFMRGVAYWYIASLWGNAIIYTRTSDLVNNYVVPANPRADVMEFAIRDLEYAAAYLPATSPESGRINKYSAYGMLSRVYLSMAGLTTEGQYDGNNVATDFNRGTRNTYYLELARKAAMKVINESDFKLMTNYGELFCVWFDNACGEGPNGKKQVYDFPRYIELIRKYQPNAVIFNDFGPDVRWCGNEAGSPRQAEWSVVPTEMCPNSPVQTGPGPPLTFSGSIPQSSA